MLRTWTGNLFNIRVLSTSLELNNLGSALGSIIHKRSVCAQSCPILCHPMNCSPPGSSVLGDSPGKNIGECPPPGDLPNPRIKPRSPTLQADSLPSEPPGDVSKLSSHLKESTTGHRSLQVRVGWCLLQVHIALKGVCAIKTVNC